MGGIKAHGKGIQITFYWNGTRHRPTLRIEPTATNLKYASRLKGEIERAISLGTYTSEQYATHFPTSRIAKTAPPTSRTPTFRFMSEQWLSASSHLSAGTLTKYNKALKFWLGKLGEEPIDNISYSTIAVLSNAQGWRAKNRNNMLIPLRGVMEMAYLDGLIENNPADRIKNAKVQKKPPDPLEAEEVDQIIKHLRWKYDDQVANLIEFSFFTGMRPSEVISLQWKDIDHRRGLARVERARTFGEEHKTKTFKVRDIELNVRAKAALSRQKAHTFKKDSYVFENPVTGLPYTEERPIRRAYWNPTLEALGIRQRTFYQTRHTYATLNLMAGANPMWVARQLGHVNMNMVLTVYSKWIDGADKSKERGKIDAMFTDTATNTPQEEEKQT